MRLLNLNGKVIEMKCNNKTNIYYILYETQRTIEYLNENSSFSGKFKITLINDINIINDTELSIIYSCNASSSSLKPQQPTKITTTSTTIPSSITIEKNNWCKITNFNYKNLNV